MSEPIQYIIDNKNGIKNTLQIYRSVENVNKVVFCLPALGVRASYYLEMGLFFAQNGYHFATIDWRGNGKSSVRPSYDIDFGYKELIEDTNDALDVLIKKFPTHKVIIFGHSLGGQIGSLLLSKYPLKIHKLILIASCNVYYKGFGKSGLKVKWGAKIIPTISNVFGHFPGKKLGFGGREAQQVMKDWSFNALKGIYQPKNDPFDYEKAMKNCEKTITAISIKGDDMAPYDAVENLISKFKNSKNKKHIVFESNDPNIDKLNHFNWVKFPNLILEKLKTQLI